MVTQQATESTRTTTGPAYARGRTGPAPGNLPTTQAIPGFSTLLRHYRERLGWKQATLGPRAGYDASYINRLESGVREPTRTAVGNLSKALRLSGSERVALYTSAGYLPDELRPVVWALAGAMQIEGTE